MASVYHIVAIRVNETSWAYVWRLHFRYLRMGYDTPDGKKMPMSRISSNVILDKL
jgi:hypothetical protein